MVSFWLLFLVSIVNVGLGYALAVYLGYGPPSLRDAWAALGTDGVSPGARESALPSAANVVSSGNSAQQDRLQEANPIADQDPSRQLDNGVETPEASAEYGGGAT